MIEFAISILILFCIIPLFIAEMIIVTDYVEKWLARREAEGRDKKIT